MEAKKALLPAAFAAAIAASAVFIEPEEGISLKAYQDSVKVWTICMGHTGPEVKKGMTLTKAACDTLFRSDIWKAMKTVLEGTKGVDLPQPVLIAFTSFTFNVGDGNFMKSTARDHLNAGNFTAACLQLPRWKFAGGYDCSVRSNNCWGVWERRQREMEMCLSGVPK